MPSSPSVQRDVLWAQESERPAQGWITKFPQLLFQKHTQNASLMSNSLHIFHSSDDHSWVHIYIFHFTWAWFNSEITAYFINVLTWKESWYFLVTRKATLLPLLSLKTFILYHVSTRQFLFNTCSTDFCTRLATKFFRTFCVQTTSLTFNFSGMPTNQCDRYFLDTAFAAHFQATTA